MNSLIGVMILLATSGIAQESSPAPKPDGVPNPQIVFPIIPVLDEDSVPVDDLPEPKPQTGPTFVSELSEETWLVIESPSPLIVLHSPTGYVAVQPEEGPVKVRGKFVDGSGKIETRTFSSKHLYFVNAVKAGKIEMLIVPAGVQNESDVMRRPLTVMGITPIPPPGPVDPPKPIDPPNPVDPPSPIQGDANRVLIVYESGEVSILPTTQAVLLASQTVRDYLSRKCSKGPAGTPEFRIWDKDVDTKNVDKVWQEAMQIKRDQIPWLIVSNGKTGYSGPLPVTEAELMVKLKQYLGE
jgi:hypothetical protein